MSSAKTTVVKFAWYQSPPRVQHTTQPTKFLSAPDDFQTVLEGIPWVFQEGQVLSFLKIRRAFVRRAAALGLPVALSRRISNRIDRLDYADVQLCLDFDRAA